MHLSSYCNTRHNLDTKRQSHFIFATDETCRFATNMNGAHNVLIESDKKIGTLSHSNRKFRLKDSINDDDELKTEMNSGSVAK